MKSQAPTTHRKLAVTLLELLVVVLIISVLATIATGVYTGQAERARVAAMKDLIRQLEMGITRYEVDLGVFPPSGSGDLPITTTRVDGSGYLHLVLTSSSSGVSSAPSSQLWRGPYINVRADQVQAPSAAAALSVGQFNFLDPWNNPVMYVESTFYPVSTANFRGGTELFPSTLPAGASASYPAPNPYRVLGETYYNPQSYQIWSHGPNRTTIAAPFHGTDVDDINNSGIN